MHPHPDIRAEAAIYWTAVSLIVCEGLSIDKAAERLGVEDDRLRTILHRRQTMRPFADSEAKPKAKLIRLSTADSRRVREKSKKGARKNMTNANPLRTKTT